MLTPMPRARKERKRPATLKSKTTQLVMRMRQATTTVRTMPSSRRPLTERTTRRIPRSSRLRTTMRLPQARRLKKRPQQAKTRRQTIRKAMEMPRRTLPLTTEWPFLCCHDRTIIEQRPVLASISTW